MAYSMIQIKEKDNIGILTINRPKALNALNTALLKELLDAVRRIESEKELRVLVITGSGEKAFVAGADITELSGLNPVEAAEFTKLGHSVMEAIEQLPIPVIAAVNGFALGGGLELALSCDFIYAAKSAKLGLPEINLGIIPGFGGTQRLARRIGSARAKELIFTGKMITAREAETLGIVNRVVPAESLMEVTIETAKIIASKGAVSLYAAKQAITCGLDVDLATGCKLERQYFAWTFASPDAKEGTTAFLEKRSPDFKGTLKG